MTESPVTRSVLPDDPTPEWADKTGRSMGISADWSVTRTSPTNADQSWGEYSACWAEYLAGAVVRWIVLFAACYPMRHESGARGWLKEAIVVFVLFFGFGIARSLYLNWP
jgi:hypothetical protein